MTEYAQMLFGLGLSLVRAAHHVHQHCDVALVPDEEPTPTERLALNALTTATLPPTVLAGMPFDRRPL